MEHKEIKVEMNNPFGRRPPRRQEGAPEPPELPESQSDDAQAQGVPSPAIVSRKKEDGSIEVVSAADAIENAQNDTEFKFFHFMQFFDYFVFKLRENPSTLELSGEEKSCVENFMSVCASTIGGCGCNKDSKFRVALEAYRTLCSSESPLQRGVIQKVKENLNAEVLIFLNGPEEISRI